MRYLLLGITLVALPSLSFAAGTDQRTPLERGFDGALHVCENWILDPQQWVENPKNLIEQAGLGAEMGMVDDVPDIALPPPSWRQNTIYWRINSTLTGGYILVTSTTLPICHITGGARKDDLYPVVKSVLTSADFQERWSKIDQRREGDMTSITYRSVSDPNFTLTVSHPSESGGSLDRVQVLASAQYAVPN
ncbi:hypothetical protein D6851_08030 [Altericroceibacterium spongiae]|uniref:Uncharacterized protein n=1 Tax=Altericroceibacterium spongiae TaxID=2320269 RepID=A0A420EMJ7_9SPHN|nr:hypothetical protein [Altericroceibacterium spongiae]RKF21949.1 hypothetical protein D6851_08030 [Altericroceibacterium spongiae]